MGNFSIALSGLQANSVALNTIGNNLANLNTTAFKGQTTAFEDLFYQQIGQSGSGDAIQVGAGTRVSGTSTNFTEGTILPDSNANSADMALVGLNEGAQATQNFSVTTNLNSGATGGTSFSTPVQIFDSLGQSHQATVSY